MDPKVYVVQHHLRITVHHSFDTKNLSFKRNTLWGRNAPLVSAILTHGQCGSGTSELSQRILVPLLIASKVMKLSRCVLGRSPKNAKYSAVKSIVAFSCSSVRRCKRPNLDHRSSMKHPLHSGAHDAWRTSAACSTIQRAFGPSHTGGRLTHSFSQLTVLTSRGWDHVNQVAFTDFWPISESRLTYVDPILP